LKKIFRFLIIVPTFSLQIIFTIKTDDLFSRHCFNLYT